MASFKVWGRLEVISLASFNPTEVNSRINLNMLKRFDFWSSEGIAVKITLNSVCSLVSLGESSVIDGVEVGSDSFKWIWNVSSICWTNSTASNKVIFFNWVIIWSISIEFNYMNTLSVSDS